jgi:hypothetical protein
MPRPVAGLLSLALLVWLLAVDARSAEMGSRAARQQERTLNHQSPQPQYLLSTLVHAASQAELDAARATLQVALALWRGQLGESQALSLYRELPPDVYDKARAERDAVVELVDILGRVPMTEWDAALRERVAAVRARVGPPRETRYFKDALARRDSVEELRHQRLRETGVDILGGITPEQHLNEQLGFGDMGRPIRGPSQSPDGDVGK